MCCFGCAAVAELLEAQGLASWYETREEATGVRADPVPDVLRQAAWIESPDVVERFTTRRGDHLRESTLLVEGISCAACVWLIEEYLRRQPGVCSASVSLTSHRARVAWDETVCGLGDLVARLAEIGFASRPDRPDERATLERREHRSALIRLGVSGLGAMNVMTYSVALYVGAFEGMAAGFESFFRWLCFLVATPVVVIAGRPFFAGAIRDLRVGRPGMDVPVALAIGGAFGVSGWATIHGGGEVFFDSACMFIFFLTLGRFLEMRVRHRSASLSRRLLDAAPAIARRIVAGREEVVSAESLVLGDRFLVRAGESLPADGRILEGSSAIDESLLTGEPWPRDVSPADSVVAGSVNVDSPILVEAMRVGDETTMASIVSLIERAESEKPAIASAADRVAGIFVGFVLCVAALAAVGWGLHAPERAIWTTLAVLVATCPCALSLATPAALAAATHGLAEAGLLVTRGHVLEGLANASRVVFDKTGTLTRGEPTLVEVVPLRPGLESDELLELARRLERHSEHPLARALREEGTSEEPLEGPGRFRSVAGRGVEGKLESRRVRIGRPDWVAALSAAELPGVSPDAVAQARILLGDESGPLAWLGFSDPLRSDAVESIRRLEGIGLGLEMLSGDPSPGAGELARRLGLDDACPGATPEMKVDRIQELQQTGERVVVVGDGVNDGPVTRAATVSIAMGSGADLTRLAADAVLMRDDLSLLPLAIDWSRRVRRIMRQNFAWAIAYNVCALPLALSGLLAPWLAAIGMSASSLVVVLNATRLGRPPVVR